MRTTTTLALLLVAAAACKARAPAAQPQPAVVRDGPDRLAFARDAPQWRYIQVEVAREAAPLSALPYPARIAVDEQRTSAVSAPLPGRVERILVRVGDVVERGARLFSARSGALAELVKQVETAQAQVAVKRRIVERTRSLVELRAVPEKDQLAAEAELKEAELALVAARAKRDSVSVATEASNRFWVTAPRRGVVIELEVTNDQEVAPEREKPLLRISDLSEVLAVADVPDADAKDVRPGMAADVRRHGDPTARRGTVEKVSQVVVTARQSVEVRVRVPNRDGAFRPNGFAEVTFLASQPTPRVKIPSDAVITDGARSLVFVARDERTLERVEVVPGRQQDGETEIVRGLSPGTRYVAHGALLLLNEIDLQR